MRQLSQKVGQSFTMVKNKNRLLLHLAKNPFATLHLRGLERTLGIPVQTLSRLVKQLQNERIVVIDKIGKALVPKFSFSDKAMSTAKIAMIDEYEAADPYIRRWVTELQGLKDVDIIILFGSVLTRKKEAKDIDVLFVASKEKIKKLSKEIREMNKINVKRIHPLYQSHEDLRENLRKKDEVVLTSLNGIIVRGQEMLMKIIQEGVK